MILDFKTGEEIQLQIDPDKPAEIVSTHCYHWHLTANEASHQVTCQACGEVVDPFTALLKLIRFYENRIDNRLAEIRAFNERERIKRERRLAKRKEPREALLKRRQESLERAAFNDYQAQLLNIRAERQRAAAERIVSELAEEA